MKYTDKRAKEIAEAAAEIEALKPMLTSVTSTEFAQVKEALQRAIDRKEAALAMPQHQYECLLCPLKDGKHKSFESVGRAFLEVRAIVPHDDEGSPTTDEQHFRSEPMYLVICPNCMTKKKVMDYFLKRWSE